LGVSCAPQFSYFNIDVLDKESKELDLEDKTIAVFSVVPSEPALDSIIINSAAIGAAEKIEQDRELENGSINVYTIPKMEFENSFYNNSVDTLYFNSLMLKSEADIQVFITNLKYSNYKKVTTNYYNEGPMNVYVIPYLVKMKVYDALQNTSILDKSIQDTAYLAVEPSVNNIIKHIPEISKRIGVKVASYISKQWTTQERMLVNFPDISSWSDPYNKAMDFMWKDAISGWIPLTKSKNMRKAAYASYNIAVACEMLDRLDLAKEWVEFSLKSYPFPSSNVLKKRVEGLISKEEKKK
jgi:hypothetical protein